MNPEHIGYDSSSDRKLFLLEVSSTGEIPKRLLVTSPHFAVLVLADGAALSNKQIGHLASTLIDSGAVYLSTWGVDCERMHDLFDEVLIGDGTGDQEAIITTWHDEPLDDALFSFLRTTSPAEEYSGSCRSSIVVIVGMPNVRASVRRVLQDPSAFIERYYDGEE